MSTMKIRIFEIISRAEDSDRASRIFDLSIMGLIILSVLSIILQSFDTLATQYAAAFHALEAVTVVVICGTTADFRRAVPFCHAVLGNRDVYR